MALIGFGTASLGVAVVTSVLTPEGRPSETASPFLVACLGVFMLAMTLAYWIIPLFNRPKFLVPPMYRAEDGIITARRRRKATENG
ncbi:hypothetical protein [Actinorhabdospora filicis]|nr:hypothetical protein [Actinorhabdospora filicis]